jgi:hypothetical protein
VPDATATRPNANTFGLSLINLSLANTREMKTRAKHAGRSIDSSKSAFDTSPI